MNIQELLTWTDDQVFAKTGQHLDSLQKSILKGVLQFQTYQQIAENIDYNYNYDYVKAKGADLWKLLSEVFEKDIKQNNVRSILENQAGTIYNFGNSSFGVNLNSHINICRENQQTPEAEKKPFPSPSNQNKPPIIDLTEAPELSYKYGRTSEISTLKEWIKNQTKLITICGIGGIGKTALTLKLISEIQTEFDYIIYRSLENIPKLITLKDNLKQFFSQSQATPLPEIIDYFRDRLCLVILDDVQNIFKPGELAGQYLPEYEDYSKFFEQIATKSHQSCLILISREKIRDTHIQQTLQLKGLGEATKEILREKGLKDEEKFDQLIKIYLGNPCWLNIIAATIIELFDGRVSRFFNVENQVFLGDIKPLLKAELERLSESEKKVINWLANEEETIDICQKPVNLEVSQAEFIEVIQSLIRRSLVEKIQIGESTNFQLNLVFKAYLKSNY